jgi:KUP system potassium uptake protein
VDGDIGTSPLYALRTSFLPEHGVVPGAANVLGVPSMITDDGMITPAISVLSAVEGLGVVTPVFEPCIVPITIGILALLLLVQSRGTGSVGRVFVGPLTLRWFLTPAVLGARNILQEPHVFAALSPVHAIQLPGQPHAASPASRAR